MADIIPAYKTGIERLGMVTSQRFNEVAKFASVQTNWTCSFRRNGIFLPHVGL